MNRELNKRNKIILQTSSLFDKMNIEEISSLIERGEICKVNEKEVILDPGDSNSYVCIVLEGTLDVKLPENDDLLAILSPGQCVGEMSILDNVPPSARVSGHTEAVVLKLNRDLFWQILKESHSVAVNLLTILSKRVRVGNVTISEEIKLQKEFKKIANIDPLTKLFNRRGMITNFTQAMKASVQRSFPVSLNMIDIDFFKKFNDTYGHIAGDHVLIQMGKALKNYTRDEDIVARYGGEEFSILFFKVSLDEAFKMADEIRDKISKLSLKSDEFPYLPNVNLSMGIALYDSSKDENIEVLIARADEALYQSKKNGRNKVTKASK
jgi:diguanylate cyclase (GGDEF)-like protein